MPSALRGGCAVAPATRTVVSTPASRRMTPRARFIAPSAHVAPFRPSEQLGGAESTTDRRRARRARIDRFSVVRLRHRAVVERLVEDGVLDALLARDLPQGTAARGRLLHDLGRLVVADVRVEGGRGGQRQLGVALVLL